MDKNDKDEFRKREAVMTGFDPGPAPDSQSKGTDYGGWFVNFIIDHPVLFTVLAIIAMSPVSYGLALIGEPRAVWIWRDILGLI